MKTRCFNVNIPSYKVYGAKGITRCNDWMFNYSEFKNRDLKNCYSDDLTLDRVNVKGNYESSNCRWVTIKEQENNRTNNRLLTYKGETRTIS